MKDRKRNKSKGVITAVALAIGLVGLSACSQKTSEEHIFAARQYIAANNNEAALVSYRNAIQMDPKSAQARFELGRLYIDMQEFGGAEKELNRALELGYAEKDVIPLLAVAYQRTGAENALAKLDHEVAGLTPAESVKVGFYKIQAMLRLDKQDDARELITALKDIDTRSEYKMMIVATEQVLDQDSDAALATLAEAKNIAPLNKDLLLMQGRLLLASGQAEEAVEVYQQYVKSFPKDVENKFALAALLVDQQRLKEAEPYVDDLLKVSETNGLLNQFKGMILANEGKYEQALTFLEKAVQNGRNDAIVRLVAGFSAYQLQDFEAAARHLTMVATSLPDNHPGLRMLADSLLQLGENQEANDVLTRISGDSQADAALFTKAGYQFVRSGNVVDAKEMIEKTSGISTTPADLTRLGILKLSVNDLNGIVNLEDAATQAPDSAITQQVLASAYLLEGKLEEAKNVVAQWKEAQPDAAAPFLTEARIAIQENDFALAQQALSTAEKKSPDNSNVKLAQVNLLMRQNKTAEAKQVLDQVVAKEPTNVTALAVKYAMAKEAGDASQVISEVQSTLKANPDDNRVRILTARLQLMETQYDAALKTLAPIKTERTLPVAYWDTRGQALIRGGKVDEAEKLYTEWLKYYPNNKNAALGKLLIDDVKANFKSALALSQKFQEKRPDQQMALLESYFHAMLQHADEAQAILDKASDEEKALPFVKGIQARVYLLKEEPAKAVPLALAAYEEKANSRNMMVVYVAYEQSGQSDKAKAFLNEHVAAHPEDLQAQMMQSQNLLSSDKKQAIEKYEAIVKKTPDNFVALNNLAYLYYEAGNLERASTLAEKAVNLQPKSTDTIDTLAQINVAKGDLSEARRLYETVINDQESSEEVYLNYIEVLLKLDARPLALRKISSRPMTTDASRERLKSLSETYGF